MERPQQMGPGLNLGNQKEKAYFFVHQRNLESALLPCLIKGLYLLT